MKVKLLSHKGMCDILSWAEKNLDQVKKQNIQDPSFIVNEGPFKKINFVFEGSPRSDYSAKFGYVGATRTLYSTKDAFEILHDSAHFFLASEKRRSVNDFGLGQGYQTVNIGDTPELLNEASRQIEEEAACALSWSFAVHFGIQKGAIADDCNLVDMVTAITSEADGKKYYDNLISFIKKRNLEKLGFRIIYPN